MKKGIKSFIAIVVLIICIVGAIFIYKTRINKSEETDSKSLQVIVYDRENNSVFDKKISTNEKILIDALKSIDGLTIKTEDSQYGEYIVEINELEQGDDYYWNFYVNDEYAQVGASSYEIQDNDIVKFKLEKFE